MVFFKKKVLVAFQLFFRFRSILVILGYFGHFLGFGVFWSLFKFKGYFGHFGHFLGSKGILVILEGFGDILPILNI